MDLSGFYLVKLLGLSSFYLFIEINQVVFYPITHRVDCYLANMNNEVKPTQTDKVKPT